MLGGFIERLFNAGTKSTWLEICIHRKDLIVNSTRMIPLRINKTNVNNIRTSHKDIEYTLILFLFHISISPSTKKKLECHE
jgi:hypothetical protein